MNKNVLKTGLLVLLIVVAIVSVYANFRAPAKSSELDISLTFNVSEDDFQPIFIDKYGGITKVVNAKFETKRIGHSVKLEKIDLNVLRMSGLMDYKITKAVFVQHKECPYQVILLKVSPFSGSLEYSIPLSKREIYLNDDDEILTFVDYEDEYDKIFENPSNPEHCFYIKDPEGNRIEEPKLIVEGRICNIKVAID